MLPGDREAIEGREASCLAAAFHIELRADTPDEPRSLAFGGKHPTQKEQVARLHRLHVGAERFGRLRQRDTKFC